MAALEYAPNMFRALNGVFCLFKPKGVTMKGVRMGLKKRLANDLNKLECRGVSERVLYHGENLDSKQPVVTTVPDLADSPLVVGPRYLPEDVEVGQAGFMDYFVSGVMVLGLSGRGIADVKRLQDQRPLRVYHLSGVLGYATHNYMSDGRPVEKSTFHHVTHHKLDRILASMQANHSRRLWNTAALPLQSEEAYERACRGPLRPHSHTTEPHLYALRCIHFHKPHFTLEVHVINESGGYLAELVHELGLRLHTNAACSEARRIRFGDFCLEHALLKHEWRAADIVRNVALCRGLYRTAGTGTGGTGTLQPSHRAQFLHAGHHGPPEGEGGRE